MDAIDAVRTLLISIGEDPDREGLRDTPERVTRAYKEWFAGYAQNPKEILGTTFEESEGYAGIVMLRDIPVVSCCEHHMAPIVGVATVAYVPRGRVVGVSKLARVVDCYARRLQIQERLTRQIANALQETLDPVSTAVIITASHHCMVTRGVKHADSRMTTATLLGGFRDDSAELNALLAHQK